MKAAFLVWILTILTCSLRATTPIIEPLNDSLARFEKSYPARCDYLLRELRHRIHQPAESFAVLDHYLSNIREDDLPRLHNALAAGQRSKAILACLDRLVADLAGYRRTLDELLIDSVAAHKIVLDQELLADLHKFWDDEYYFTWRFHEEVQVAIE
jgi:hypothetical protein